MKAIRIRVSHRVTQGYAWKIIDCRAVNSQAGGAVVWQLPNQPLLDGVPGEFRDGTQAQLALDVLAMEGYGLS